MRRWSLSVVACVIGLTVVIGQAAGVLAAEFYKDKSVRIIVPFSPGGGFDTYARLIARRMGKHIPGNPTFIVQNMPGASGLIAYNYVNNIARRDGLTIGNFQGYEVVSQLLGQSGGKFDVRKFNWIGVPSGSYGACALTRASGITSLEKWRQAKTPVPLGSSSRGVSYASHIIMKKVLGLPIQIVTGYRGTSRIRMAAESGEVAGSCWDWNSIKVTWREALDAGRVSVVLQLTAKPHPELLDVPVAMDLAKTEEARLLLNAGAVAPRQMARSYMVAPGTPKPRVKILQKAFMDTMKDREFRSHVKRLGFQVDPLNGEQVKKIVDDVFKLDPKIVAKLKKLLM